MEHSPVCAQRDEVGPPVGPSDCDETLCENLADRLELIGRASIRSRTHDSSVWRKMKHEHPVAGDKPWRSARRDVPSPLKDAAAQV
jgi:hypothetical protein